MYNPGHLTMCGLTKLGLSQHHCRGVDFDWHRLSPRGRSGGILRGVKCETLEVLNVVHGEFAVKFQVR